MSSSVGRAFGLLTILGIAVAVVTATAGTFPDGRATVGAGAAFSADHAAGTNTDAVSLVVYNSSVEAGTPALFLLSISNVNCSLGAPPNESVSSLVLRFGDGFNLLESAPPGLDCQRSGNTASILLTYAYRSSGSYTISAVVAWADGSTLTSNSVTLLVTSLPSTAAPVLQLGLWIASAALGATVAVSFALRRLLLPPPSLPPGAV
jgi:hypothetical protein